jgi:hypothetical protein
MPAWVLHPPVEPVGASFARSVVKQQYFRKRMHDRPLSEGVRYISRMHPEKSGIVYCRDRSRTQAYPNVTFTFLGFLCKGLRMVEPPFMSFRFSFVLASHCPKQTLLFNVDYPHNRQFLGRRQLRQRGDAHVLRESSPHLNEISPRRHCLLSMCRSFVLLSVRLLTQNGRMARSASHAGCSYVQTDNRASE